MRRYVGEPLEHVRVGQHADRRTAVGDEHGRTRLQVVVDIVQTPRRLHHGQRIAHQLGGRSLERSPAVAHRAVEERALVHAAEDLAALADHRELRDGEALKERDRVGHRLLGRDADERRHVAPARRDELAGGGRPHRAVEHAVHEHPVVVEDLREVGPAAVGQDDKHGALGRQLCGDAERGVQREPARGADQDALLARDPARGGECVTIGDAQPSVDDVPVECRRPEILADPLHEIRMHLLARVDRADGIGAHDLQSGLALLQVVARSRDRAARPDSGDQDVELLAELFPDLGPGGVVMRLGVGGIGVLVGIERAGRLRGHATRDRVVRARVLRLDLGRADDDLGAERPQQGDLLARHLVRHHEDAAVAALRRDLGQTDPGIARRRLDDGAARPQKALALGRLDHGQPDAILDRSARVEVLELREQARAATRLHSRQPHDRRAADQVEDRRKLPHGGDRSRGLPEGADQCEKWRRPVNTSVPPAFSTAAMTSSSRFEPPG
jgi:hypothetical protein